jgi:hypothetical protein
VRCHAPNDGCGSQSTDTSVCHGNQPVYRIAIGMINHELSRQAGGIQLFKLVTALL